MRLITLLILLLTTVCLPAQSDSLSTSSAETNEVDNLNLNSHWGIDTTDQVALNQIAEFAENGNTEEALKRYQLWLTQLLPEFNKTDIAENPSESDLYYASPLVLKILLEKASLLEKQADPKDKSGNSLEQVLEINELVIDALFHLRQNYQGAALAYENGQAERELEWKAVNLAYQLYEKSNNPSYLLRCFRLVEKSKKAGMLNALIQPQTAQLANVPKEDLEELSNRKLKVAALKSEWANVLNDSNNKNTEAANRAKNDYITARKAYNRKVSEFSKRFPTVYGLRYNEAIVTVGEIQNRLESADQVLLSYYFTDEYLYGFVITLNGLKAKRLKRPANLDAGIMRLHEILKNEEEQSDCTTYDSLALQMYETLIQPFEPLKKQVIIIPDEGIGYLPFNALLSTAPPGSCNFSNYPFLLNKYQISLHYDAEEFAKEAYANNTVTNCDFTILNSDEKQSASFIKGENVKIGSSKEKELVSNMQSTPLVLLTDDLTAYTGKERGKTEFLWYAEINSDGANDEDAGQLVVLSDNQVSLILPTEGDHIPSTSRGLIHYGAKSVLTTLWPVPVTTNEELLPVFYKQLKKGKDKTTALHNSNKNYLSGTLSAEAAAPSKWAAYTLIGNVDVISEQNWYWLLLGLIPFFYLWYFLRKRKKERLRKEREVTTTMEY
ncbi:MAG: CHAT domain-containing protein [Saprospiraceae bacterium]